MFQWYFEFDVISRLICLVTHVFIYVVFVDVNAFNPLLTSQFVSDVMCLFHIFIYSFSALIFFALPFFLLTYVFSRLFNGFTTFVIVFVIFSYLI